MTRPSKFPWPTPEPGCLEPVGGDSDPVTAVHVVEWFIERWAPGSVIHGGSPLGTILGIARGIETGANSGEARSAAEDDAWRQRALNLRMLDWSIRALHGRAGKLTAVHQSFIRSELLGADSRGSTWKMPLGVGTLHLAAKLVQASGGRLTINGTRAAGHDIHWEPATGGRAIIERKDRAYDVGVAEPLARRARHVASKIREAGRNFPPLKAGRVLAVGFPGFVAEQDADEIRSALNDEIAKSLGPARDPEFLPDSIIVEFTGATLAESGLQEQTNFYCFLDLGFDRPEWARVRRGFTRAFTLDGRKDPSPWPIPPAGAKPVG